MIPKSTKLCCITVLYWNVLPPRFGSIPSYQIPYVRTWVISPYPLGRGPQTLSDSLFVSYRLQPLDFKICMNWRTGLTFWELRQAGLLLLTRIKQVVWQVAQCQPLIYIPRAQAATKGPGALEPCSINYQHQYHLLAFKPLYGVRFMKSYFDYLFFIQPCTK